MKIDILDEPELEFAGGQTHVDIRFGLMNAGPLDVLSAGPRSISIGMVGTHETLEGLTRWLDRCREPIDAKESDYPRLFPRFPGFRPDVAFRSTLLLEDRLQRTIPDRALVPIVGAPRSNEMVHAAVDLFLDELRYVVERGRPAVLICAPPFELFEAVRSDPATEVSDGQAPARLHDFHDLLKARAMALGIPIQLIWPHTYDPGQGRRQRRRPERTRGRQDEATRAWNLHTALYYKAGGIPWRLVRDPAQLDTCCVGISFYEALEGDRLLTSTAQVFNERGQGVVVKGGQAAISKDDRQPHLNAATAESLLREALALYRREHKNLPARAVLHKTSRYGGPEVEGFGAAASRAGIEDLDLISLGDSTIRLYRQGRFPPLRGTLLSLDAVAHALYTKGSVDFFETYPGLYVPRPLLFRREQTDRTPRFLAQELLVLTKMNWNTTQFDGRDPITTRAAGQVGAMLRHIGPSDPMESPYSFYM